MRRAAPAASVVGCAVACLGSCVTNVSDADVIVRAGAQACGAVDDCVIDAGGVDVGAHGGGTFDVLDRGDTGAHVVLVRAGDAAFDARGPGGAAAFDVDGGASDRVAWTLDPDVVGALGATVRVQWRSAATPASGVVTVSLLGRGVSDSLAVPQACAFGSVPVGATSDPCALVVVNGTNAGVAITSAQASLAAFALDASDVPLSIPAGASAALTFRATPSAPGHVVADVAIGDASGALLAFPAVLVVDGV